MTSPARQGHALGLSLLCALAVGCGGTGLDGSAADPELATTSQAVSNWADDEELIRTFQPEWRFPSGHRCFPLNVAAGESDGDTCRGSFTPDFTVYARVNREAISSARVSGGASAEVFKDAYYGPDSRWFNGDIGHFHNNLAFNDHVSSFKVR